MVLQRTVVPIFIGTHTNKYLPTCIVDFLFFLLPKVFFIYFYDYFQVKAKGLAGPFSNSLAVYTYWILRSSCFPLHSTHSAHLKPLVVIKKRIKERGEGGGKKKNGNLAMNMFNRVGVEYAPSQQQHK